MDRMMRLGVAKSLLKSPNPRKRAWTLTSRWIYSVLLEAPLLVHRTHLRTPFEWTAASNGPLPTLLRTWKWVRKKTATTTTGKTARRRRNARKSSKT